MCVHVVIETNSSNTHTSLTKQDHRIFDVYTTMGRSQTQHVFCCVITPNDFKYSAVQLGYP